jgi:hypothetical protein
MHYHVSTPSIKLLCKVYSVSALMNMLLTERQDEIITHIVEEQRALWETSSLIHVMQLLMH